MQCLDLSNNQLRDEGLRFLVKSLHQIKKLRLCNCNLGAESTQLISETLMETKHKV